MASCMTQQKAVKFLERKDKLAEVCAKNYPVDTVTHIKSDTVIQFDTLYVPSVDTEVSFDTSRDYNPIPLPLLIDSGFLVDTVISHWTKRAVDTIKITKTITQTKTIEKIDNAALAVLKKDIADKDKLIAVRDSQITDQESKTDWWRKIALWSIAINLAFLAYFFRNALGDFLGGILKQAISKIKS